MTKRVLAPQPGKQELMLNIDADVIFLGGAAGAAKSYSLLLRFARYMKDPNFRAIYFRRNGTQLTGAGGLWDEFQDMYRSSTYKPRFRQQAMEAKFTTGASAKFMHMEHEKNRIDHQGLQYSAIFWDELTHFSETQFTYLLSRLRSKAEGDSFTMASMNPDADSWVLKWVERYLTEEGVFNEEMLGHISYFVTKDGSPIFADTREELELKYPELCYDVMPNGKKIHVPPKSFTFVGATVYDNPILLETNPKYLSELKSLPPVERARLLDGNWYARAEGSNYFDRNWLKKVDKVPLNCVECRAWDKASQEPSDANRYPDYTAASPKFLKDRYGNIYLHGGYAPENVDTENDNKIHGRFRQRPGKRDALILAQALDDGVDCKIILPIDPGAAGKVEFRESAKKLQEEGFVVKSDPMPTNKSKLTKFAPFSAACQEGLVNFVVGSFANKATENAYFAELEAFTGERSSATRKDDWADATASAYNSIVAEKTVRIVVRNQRQHNTDAMQLLAQTETNLIDGYLDNSEIRAILDEHRP